MLASERHGPHRDPLRRHRGIALEHSVGGFGETEVGGDPGRRKLAGGILRGQGLIVEELRHHAGSPVALPLGEGQLRLKADCRLEVGGRFLEAAEP